MRTPCPVVRQGRACDHSPDADCPSIANSAKPIMHARTGIGQEPAAIRRIAENHNRLENRKQAGFFVVPHRISRLMPPFRNDSPNSGAKDAPRTTVGDRLAPFEQGQRKLWRLNYGLLALVTVAFVAASWDALRSFAQRYEVLLLGVLVVVGVFMIYAWKRNQEIS